LRASLTKRLRHVREDRGPVTFAGYSEKVVRPVGAAEFSPRLSVLTFSSIFLAVSASSGHRHCSARWFDNLDPTVGIYEQPVQS
jgi:hypothetical protein